MNINIRTATAEDLSAIRALVVELAIYEKEPEAVTATLSDYQRDFAKGWFEAIVAETSSENNENEIIGMMLFFEAYSTWKGRMLYLDDFVVKQSLRGKGVGQQLFEAFLEIAKNKAVNMVKWQVLEWNTPAIKFYKKYKANFENDWHNCKIMLPAQSSALVNNKS